MKQNPPESIADDELEPPQAGDPPKNPRGRPRKDGLPAGGALLAKIGEVPRPHYPLYKSDAPQTNQRPKGFFVYWEGISAKYGSRTIAYVYREWPVLKEETFEGNEELKFIEKIPGETPLTDDLDLRARFGVGKYKIHFNEQRSKISDPKGAPLCVVYVDVMGDMKSYPPVDRHVSDVTRVDLAHPMNRSYVEFLRMRRLLPEQQNEESEMATQVASETVKELTGIIREQIQDNKERSTQQDSTSSTTGHVMKEITSGVMDAAKGIVEMTVNSAKRTMGEFDRPPAAPQDPMAMLTALAQFQAMQKPNEEVASLRRELESMRTDRMMSQFSELKSELAALRSNPAAPTGSPDSVLETVKAMRGVIEELGIGGATREEAPWFTPFVGPALQLIGQIGPALIASLNQPKPQPEAPSATVTQVGQPSQPNPAQPAQVAAPPPMDPGVAGLMMEIKTPLLNHLRSGASGADYADIFLASYGDGHFVFLKQQGADKIIETFSMFPPIWNQIQSEGITQERLRAFVNEFCAYVPQEEKGAE